MSMLVTLRKGRLFLVVFISFIIWIAVKQYLFCQSFTFKIQKPFSGKSFYNPYDSIDPGHWVKCNFHAHTNAWHGFTHGKVRRGMFIAPTIPCTMEYIAYRIINP